MPAEETKQDETEKVMAMYKYVLKVATLDENLIVKQKARTLNHLLDNQDTLKIAPEVEEQKVQESNQMQSEIVRADSELWVDSELNQFKLLSCGQVVLVTEAEQLAAKELRKQLADKMLLRDS